MVAAFLDKLEALTSVHENRIMFTDGKELLVRRLLERPLADPSGEISHPVRADISGGEAVGGRPGPWDVQGACLFPCSLALG